MSFIRSFCSYRRFVTNPKKRQQFIDFIHLEMYNTKESESLPYYHGQPMWDFKLLALCQVSLAPVNKDYRTWVASPSQACLEWYFSKGQQVWKT